MKWTGTNNVNRQIVMVGNETAFQGPVDYRLAAKAASSRGFTVSAMYCPAISDERGRGGRTSHLRQPALWSMAG
jgi:hypothetical protein